jgi:hypothetical protein
MIRRTTMPHLPLPGTIAHHARGIYAPHLWMKRLRARFGCMLTLSSPWKVGMVRRMLWLPVVMLLVSCGQPATSPPVASAPTTDANVVLSSITGANPGERASATISAPPNTRCTIVYTMPDGREGHLPGLGAQMTNARGKATWSWYIPTNTPRGIGMVAITCGGITRAERILIGVGE